MRWLYAVVMLVGCRSTDTGPITQVLALAGDTALEPGATVISHRADGTILDQQVTDGSGRGIVAYEPGAYVSVLYTRDGGTQMITAPALAAGTLAIHGPDPARQSILAGTVVLTAVPITADAYAIDLGCITLPVTSLPMYVDINAFCLGNDPSIDMLVEATSAGALVGYAATRIRIQDEVGMFDVPAWTAAPLAIPIQNDSGATLELSEISDTFAFPTPAATADTAFAWDGLVADGSRVRATLGASVTTQYLAGLPTTISVTSADFLPAPTTALAFDGHTFAWTAFGIGDVTNLHATWGTTTWDVALDPSTATIALPELSTLGLSAPGSDLATTLRAIDGPDTASFADVVAAGIYAASIVPPPTTGEVREAVVTGFH